MLVLLAIAILDFLLSQLLRYFRSAFVHFLDMLPVYVGPPIRTSILIDCCGDDASVLLSWTRTLEDGKWISQITTRYLV